MQIIKVFLFITCLATSSQSLLAAETTFTDTLPPYSTVYDPKRDAFEDGAAAIKLATQTQRRILIELGGNWCLWCHQMDAFFEANPDIKQQLHETFVMLKINVSDANDNADFLKAFPKALGYPHMFVAEYNGNVLWSQDTAEFIIDGQYNREAFETFFKRWSLKNSLGKTNE